ncbi:MAG: GspE/PulE family protein [Candidatus Nealsonbacteria bacterium]|nr:GspE/PulE family protein [Candidatus Nealsonbacteria bacterium]
MRVDVKKLKSLMVDSGLIAAEKFDEIEKKASKSKGNLESYLISEDIVKEEDLLKLEAYILGIPFVNLEKDSIEPDVLKIIPEPIARSHNIIAFKKEGKNLEVAMIDPEDLKTIDFIKKKSDLKILPRLTTTQGIKNALMQYQKTLKAEFGDIIEKEVGDISTLKDEEGANKDEDLSKAAKELPIIRIVDTLLKHAILQKASDIHIEPSEKTLVVRYRIDGILRDAMSLPGNVASGITARIKVLSNLKLDEHRLPQDGRFKIETEDYKYSIRVSVLPIFGGEKIVMRLLGENLKTPTLEQLGIEGMALEIIQQNLNRPVGMILVTGPTGSGKTTTLYTMMEILNTPEVNISTVEDPIEYRMPRINQTQVNPKIGLTFAGGLRSLLRQDPDIIMVGEIRDNETAGLAINAALTGHLVLSTLHTNNAAGAIPRLIDMQAEPFLISSTLNKDSWKNVKFYRPDSKDANAYSGRIGIYEVLNVSPAIKDMIVKRATADHIQEQAKSEGMRSMVEDGFIKAAKGITTIEEVLRVITE